MKVVLIDDHALFRVGIRHVLAMSSEFELVGEAATAREGFKLIEATVPDVVIMDISLPGMDGVLATRELKRRAPLARVLIVTAHSEIHDVLDAMSAGAVGYALKSDGPEVLLEALQQVARGQRYVAPASPRACRRWRRSGGARRTCWVCCPSASARSSASRRSV